MAAPRENHVIVRYVIDQQHSLAEAARFGVSRQGIHVLIQRYLADHHGRDRAALQGPRSSSRRHPGRGGRAGGSTTPRTLTP